MTSEEPRDRFWQGSLTVFAAAVYMGVILALDLAVYAFLFVVGFAEIEPLWNLGWTLRHVLMLMGLPFVYPIIYRTVPETILPLCTSPVALAGYATSGLLWSFVLLRLFRRRRRAKAGA